MVEPELTADAQPLTETLRAHRDALASVRRLRRSRPTRNVGATTNAIADHTRTAGVTASALIRGGEPWRTAVGLAAAETQLVDRIREAKAQHAPDTHVTALQARLTGIRRTLNGHRAG